MEAVPGLLQFLDFTKHKTNRTYWKQVFQLLQYSNLVKRWDWLWSFIHRQNILKPHTVVLLFSSRGSWGAAIWRSDYTRGLVQSIWIPLVPSSGRMRDNMATNHPSIITHGSLGYNNTTVLNLTVLHFLKWHRGSLPWIPECLPMKCTAMQPAEAVPSNHTKVEPLLFLSNKGIINNH